MRKRIVAILLALGMTFSGLLVVQATPAAAHNESNESYWYCSKHRQSTGMTITHSNVYGVWPGIIGYYCREDFFGNSFQYWVAVSPPGSNNSWVPYERQHCVPYGFIICGH